MYQYSLLIMYFVCIYIASSLGLIPLLHAENRLEQGSMCIKSTHIHAIITGNHPSVLLGIHVHIPIPTSESMRQQR